MTDMSGPLFDPSSPHYALQNALESKLGRRLDANGSPEYELTWQHWDMRSAPRICRLRASARHTADSASTSPPAAWGTPTAHDAKESGHADIEAKGLLSRPAPLAGWATPRAGDRPGHPKRAHNHNSRLEDQAQLAGLETSTPGPTPNPSTAQTTPNAELNPEFTRWLMGYPPDWSAHAAKRC